MMGKYERCPFEGLGDSAGPDCWRTNCAYNGDITQCLKDGKVGDAESKLIAYINRTTNNLDTLQKILLDAAITRAKAKEPGDYHALLSLDESVLRVGKIEIVSDEEFRKLAIAYIQQKKKTDIGDFHRNFGFWYNRGVTECSKLLHELKGEGLIKAD